MKKIFLDVSDLEPPLPLERALQSLEQLATGEYLLLRHRREPCLLYAQLKERGFREKTVEQADGFVLVYFWHQSDQSVENSLVKIFKDT